MIEKISNNISVCKYKNLFCDLSDDSDRVVGMYEDMTFS